MKNVKTLKVRAKIKGKSIKPRLSVFRSNRFIYAQIIDDTKGKTLAAASEKEAKGASKADRAKEVGALIAKKAKSAKVSEVVFDRGKYKYHGRVKQVAEGAREGGLKF